MSSLEDSVEGWSFLRIAEQSDPELALVIQTVASVGISPDKPNLFRLGVFEHSEKES